MSGIVGIWNLNGSPVESHELVRFTESLTHRGPDGRGIYIDPNVSLGLGHRRLAILDITESGHQPMSYADGRYWITYDGSIYNFLELRDQLESLGYCFRSDTDTEIILAAYVEWGQECQFKFNGIWAFALWDSRDHTLFLSRDRFGGKPIHYLFDQNHFVFASELKAFMALNPILKPDFDPGMVARMTHTENTRKTLLRGVNNLNSGHQLILREGKAPDVKRWWISVNHLVDVPRRFDDQVAQFKKLFFDACNIRMRSDVSIGTPISGGLDSSSVLSTMSNIRSHSRENPRLAENWQQTFVVDFAGTSYSEKHRATEVIRHVGAIPNYIKISLSPISPEDLIQATYCFESILEPAIGAWYLYREMRKKGVAVSLDGVGGDGLVVGEPKDVKIAMLDAIWPWKNKRWRDLQTTLQGLYSEELEKGRDTMIPSRLELLKSNYLTFEKNKIYIIKQLTKSPDLYKAIRSVYRKFKRNFQLPEAWLLVEPAEPILLSSPSANDNLGNLRNYDRMSMSFGVESRSPFMDWNLACYAFSLPLESKIGAGFTKLILREAMHGILPESIRVRKSKLGLASPMEEWCKNALKTFILDSVNSCAFLESDIWNGQVIRDYVEDCYRKEDYRNASKSWKYIQAMILMRSFREKSLYWDKKNKK